MPDETKDTQPLIKDILEEMRSGFATLQEEMRAGFAEIDARLTAIEKRLTNFEEKFDVLNEDIIEMRRQQRRIEGRLTNLERKTIQ